MEKLEEGMRDKKRFSVIQIIEVGLDEIKV